MKPRVQDDRRRAQQRAAYRRRRDRLRAENCTGTNELPFRPCPRCAIRLTQQPYLCESCVLLCESISLRVNGPRKDEAAQEHGLEVAS